LSFITQELQKVSCFNNTITAAEKTSDENAAGIGDYFNDSYYLMCPATAGHYSIQPILTLINSTINSTNIDPYPLPPSEIFNQNLITLGDQKLDFGSRGVYVGYLSVWHFLKYYFVHILSLQNLPGDGSQWHSGLFGNGSTINIGHWAIFTK
jgi:hypothetical protein